MSSMTVYFCDCDDCYNNSMKDDSLNFYDCSEDIGKILDLDSKCFAGGFTICSDCFEGLHHDYPELTYDEKQELIWWDYTK